jgi:carboxypeptidase C (cathepsin A)
MHVFLGLVLSALAGSVAARRQQKPMGASASFTNAETQYGLGKAFEQLRISDIATVHGPATTTNQGDDLPSTDFAALAHESFTTLSHPAYPKHSVRIKKSNFCDGDVNAYTGYIDIEARHIFFYFVRVLAIIHIIHCLMCIQFESRSNPDKDDVVLWTNGGPGCSSEIGLFMELGSCQHVERAKRWLM